MIDAPEALAELPERRDCPGVGPARARTGHHHQTHQGHGLQIAAGEHAIIGMHRSHLKIDHLPADHPVRPDRARGLSEQRFRRPRLPTHLRGARQERIRLIEQRDGGEHGNALAVNEMQRAAIAPQIGVVHSRQIVEDERTAMKEFDGATDDDALFAGRPGKLRRGQCEHGAQTLAAGKERIT